MGGFGEVWRVFLGDCWAGLGDMFGAFFGVLGGGFGKVSGRLLEVNNLLETCNKTLLNCIEKTSLFLFWRVSESTPKRRKGGFYFSYATYYVFWS